MNYEEFVRRLLFFLWGWLCFENMKVDDWNENIEFVNFMCWHKVILLKGSAIFVSLVLCIV